MNELNNPENVCTVYYAVLGLLQGLNELADNPISLKEQATALKQIASNFESSADLTAAWNAIAS
ncbi:hypothetical protein ACQ4M3_08830 [Leptolyngbya sp. AN03gr2]|uniref:hypothetical protein n=1 Tax=unclassified Leptolyngbya TaxID=2650499 RepID=UPI003D3151A2